MPGNHQEIRVGADRVGLPKQKQVYFTRVDQPHQLAGVSKEVGGWIGG